MESGRLRVDKWLWAARFFKTRRLAQEAVEGGKVKLNGDRVKPAKDVKPGDRLNIQCAGCAWEVEVVALSDRRGPAEAARTLYIEDDAARARRLAEIEARRRLADPGAEIRGRPTKRSRRLIHRFTEAG